MMIVLTKTGTAGHIKKKNIIIIIEKRSAVQGWEWYAPYQSEDPIHTIPTYRHEEEKGKKSRRL